VSFTTADIPSQAGKLAIVTGANSGIGYETALELARAGAQVVLAVRNKEKGLSAALGIAKQIPGAKVIVELLDLASLASIASFAARIAENHAQLDILINNAAVMALPTRQTTQDGFEMQFGVNYLGHFALTAQLLPLLRNAKAPRTVQLSSIAHRSGQIDFGDLQGTNYQPWKAYSQSKLAMLIFALELQRRGDAHGWNILSAAAHPGVARSELIANGPGRAGGVLRQIGASLFLALAAQSSAAGALPSLLAATSPEAKPGTYYGSTRFNETRGPAGIAEIKPQALDLNTAKKLWEVSEALTTARKEADDAPLIRPAI
jgi:NAD(P)-dependent dehydrogenase (short-subunit alcohol dehydrogenase family)